MKTRIITLVSLFLLTVSIASANNYRTLKMSDRLGRTMEIMVKIENIQETFEFDTREVFEEVKGSHTRELIDIEPFMKPEAEVNENHPVYKQ